jgi:hypothetical protein
VSIGFLDAYGVTLWLAAPALRIEQNINRQNSLNIKQNNPFLKSETLNLDLIYPSHMIISYVNKGDN